MAHPEQNQWGAKLNARLSVVPRFAAGEAVVARCGGPVMMVTDTRYNGIWHDVMWFVAGEVKHDAFLRDGLRSATWLDRFRMALGG